MAQKRASTEGKVTLAEISGAMHTAHYSRCKADLFLWDAWASKAGRFDHRKPQMSNIGTTLLHRSRNEMVRSFLDYGGADWLLMIDTDQTFEADILERLMASADPVERPVIGVPVPCLKMADAKTRRAKLGHNVFAVSPPVEGDTVPWRFAEYEDLPLGSDTLVQCAGIGTGIMLVHRSVFEKIRDWVASHGMGTHWAWFQSPVYPPNLIEGEDLFFARMCANVGVAQFAHCGIDVGHVKTIILDSYELPYDGFTV